MLIVAATTLALYKPSRLLSPQIFGVSCDHDICVDDDDRRDLARQLYGAAKQFLEKQHGLDLDKPRIVFCSSGTCKDRFGLGKKAGFTLGAYGIAIAPGGWEPHYIAHELVHYWQAENFGSLVLVNGDAWLIEGMAYALSGDPRKRLSEPFEAYRRKFDEWRRKNAGIPLKASMGEALRLKRGS